MLILNTNDKPDKENSNSIKNLPDNRSRDEDIVSEYNDTIHPMGSYGKQKMNTVESQGSRKKEMKRAATSEEGLLRCSTAQASSRHRSS